MTSFAEYEQHDARGLADLVQAKEVSPAELVEAAIERIEARNPTINAVLHPCFERARRQAAAVEDLPEGPFRGVPFLLKDLKAFDAGQPSTNGSRLFADRRASKDDTLVTRFKQTGVIVCGRTNTPELGILGVTEPVLHGPTRNPWNPDHVPGGSSGGAAAAVAAGIVPIAHASDGGGSIRIPASNCGLVGLKPSRYRIPLSKPSGGWNSFVSPHVVARSVRDSAAMLDCLQGPMAGVAHRLEAPERPYAELIEQAHEPLRIAVYRGALLADDNHPACVAAVERAVELCIELGHEVVDAKPHFDRALLTRAYLITVAAGTAAAVRVRESALGRKARGNELEAKTWLLEILGENLSAGEYIEQQDIMYDAGIELDAFFDDYDLFLTSTLAQPPLRVGVIRDTGVERSAATVLRRASSKGLMLKLLDEMARDPLAPNPNTQLFNISGQPAISLPLSMHEGLPIGVQFAARLGREDQLLKLARELERAQPWFDQRSPLADPPPA